MLNPKVKKMGCGYSYSGTIGYPVWALEMTELNKYHKISRKQGNEKEYENIMYYICRLYALHIIYAAQRTQVLSHLLYGYGWWVQQLFVYCIYWGC